MVLGVTLPEDTIKLWPLCGQTMLQSPFPSGIILPERKSERKSKRVKERDQEPSHFKFQLAQNILSERTRQKQENPTHPKYGCRNSFLNLLLSPRNPSLCTFLTFSCIPLELIPFTAQHTLLPWFFFPIGQTPETGRFCEQQKHILPCRYSCGNSHWNHEGETQQRAGLSNTQQGELYFVTGCTQEVNLHMFLGCKQCLSIPILRHSKIHINRQLLH